MVDMISKLSAIANGCVAARTLPLLSRVQSDDVLGGMLAGCRNLYGSAVIVISRAFLRIGLAPSTQCFAMYLRILGSTFTGTLAGIQAQPLFIAFAILLLALENTAFVFGSLGIFSKISCPFLGIFCRILTLILDQSLFVFAVVFAVILPCTLQVGRSPSRCTFTGFSFNVFPVFSACPS